MKKELINSVLSQMMPYLNNDQAARLQETLEHALFHLTITQEGAMPENSVLPLDAFLSAKKVEGCSEKTLAYYRKTVQDMLDTIDCGDLFNGKNDRERIEVFRLQDIESIG